MEDVKTIFRIIPVSLSISGVAFLCELNLIQDLVTNTSVDCVNHFGNFNDLCFVLIPVYRFIVYPLVRKHIPSLLKMIGAGLILCVVSTVLHTAVTATVYFADLSQNSMMPLYFTIAAKLLNGIGTVLTMIFGVELVMAQSPNRMRGIMMGLMIIIIAWSTIGSKLLSRTFHLLKVSPRKIFYFYLVLPALAILMMIILVIIAKRYKLRERERHVNIQAIAEEHYERYFNQEEEYMREVGVSGSRIHVYTFCRSYSIIFVRMQLF